MNKKIELSSDLDAIDLKILQAVGADARISITSLSREVGLSQTPCTARLKRLEKEGIILGYRALLDPVKMGLDHISFVEVKLSDTRAQKLAEFNEAVCKLAEVEQCHMIAGGYDYLLKVRTKDMKSYRKVMGEKISSLPHVQQTSTYVSMEAVKEDAILD
jgi:Lrp/AsnC family leucine-responsive transcriptional regulator